MVQREDKILICGKSEYFFLLFSLFLVMSGYAVLLPVLLFFLERIIDVSSQASLALHFGVLTAFAIIVYVSGWLLMKNYAATQSLPNSEFAGKEANWKSLKELLELSLILQVGITLFESVFVFVAKNEYGLSATAISLGLLTCGASMAIFQPVIARFGKLVTLKQQQIAIGFLISSFALILFIFEQNKWFLMALIAFLGLGVSFVTPNLLALVSYRDPTTIGWALGVQSSFSAVGQIIGPLAGTALYSISSQMPFYASTILFFLSALFAFKAKANLSLFNLNMRAMK